MQMALLVLLALLVQLVQLDLQEKKVKRAIWAR